jgi:hypothetical protein
VPITRTLNPLPFGDLEPKRFEDLVRQLIYDFRPWLRLEATGRAGSDDGYDARGVERMIDTHESNLEMESEGQEDVEQDFERQWLIQCKRERSIGPAKLQKYLGEIRPGKNLYGLIFVACCDFSKKSRDVVAEWCREKGLSEFQVWSVSDIETMLMQPKNDHILFAFFGISLQIRKRSQVTALRAITTMKRKITRLLEKQSHSWMLIRGMEEDGFPYLKDGETPPWFVRQQTALDFRGLGFTFRRHMAFVGADQQWDMADACNEVILPHSNPWASLEPGFISEGIRKDLNEFIDSMPYEQRAMMTIEGFLSFADIALVDEVGDLLEGHYRHQERPIIFTRFENGRPALNATIAELRPHAAVVDGFEPIPEKRIQFFPEKFRRKPAG